MFLQNYQLRALAVFKTIFNQDEGALFTHKGNCKFCAERSKK